MSSILFPNARPGSRSLRLRIAALGAVTGLMIGAVVAYLGGSYLGIFTNDMRIEAELTTTGDSLGVNSDVKFRGMRVGRVLKVETGTQPKARIVLMKEHAGMIPADVVARVLPGTLFGNEYVDLVSAGRTDQAIQASAVVKADTSKETLRLMDTLTAAQRLLVAMNPAKLDTAISQLAAALDGRGADLGAFFGDANNVLATWQNHEPQFYRDLELLNASLDLMGDIEPQLVAAVHDSLPLARLIADRQQATTALLQDTGRLVNSLDGFLIDQAPSLPGLLTNMAAILTVMADADQRFEVSLGMLPTVLENGADAIKGHSIQMEAVVGAQFAKPYGPEDCPRYGSLKGRNCR